MTAPAVLAQLAFAAACPPLMLWPVSLVSPSAFGLPRSAEVVPHLGDRSVVGVTARVPDRGVVGVPGGRDGVGCGRRVALAAVARAPEEDRAEVARRQVPRCPCRGRREVAGSRSAAGT